MASNDAAVMYRRVSAHGSSPVGLIVSLYDTILRDFGRAIAALEAGNVETRVFELNHAITVIGHLEEILDHRRGGEAAKQFEQFYQVTRGMIVEANTQSSRASIERLIELYGSLRQAWQEAEHRLGASPPEPPPSPRTTSTPRVPVPAGAMDAPEAPRKNWSA